MKKIILYFKKLTVRDYIIFFVIISFSAWNYHLYERIDELEYEVDWLDAKIDENHDLAQTAKDEIDSHNRYDH